MKRSFNERLAEKVAKRKMLEGSIDAVIDRLTKVPNLSDETQLVARVLILCAYDRFHLDQETIEAGPAASEDFAAHIAKVAELAKSLEELIASQPEFSSRIDAKVRDGQTVEYLARTINLAAGFVMMDILDADRDFHRLTQERANVARVVCEGAAKAYQIVTGLRPTANNDPITHARTGKFVNFLSEIFDALGISASAGNMAQTMLRQKPEWLIDRDAAYRQ